MAARYVVGFLFSRDLAEVCLIRKNRPEWQRGRLNGVGGHIEVGETPLEAMGREFQEEAGRDLEWRQFCHVWGDEYEVYYFTATDGGAITTLTDEVVSWVDANALPEDCLAILRWLVPMARYDLPISATVHHASPTCK